MNKIEKGRRKHSHIRCLRISFHAMQSRICQEVIINLVICLNGCAVKDACQIMLAFMSVFFKRTFSLKESVRINIIEHKNKSCKMAIYEVVVTHKCKSMKYCIKILQHLVDTSLCCIPRLFNSMKISVSIRIS